MRPSGRRVLAILCLLLFAALLLASSRGRALAPAARGERPRLVVVLVIDQFRADYLERFREQFGPDGFNRLLREGAYFSSCFFPYAKTNTAPGHASLATGTTPDRHGIVDNSWYRHALGRRVPAVFDAEAPLVDGGATGAGVSPHILLSDTLADRLRLATEGEAKAFGVAIKDRAAVLSTGHIASGAYWWEGESGRFVTSRYYRDSLPAWVEAFNGEGYAHDYYGLEWKAGDRVFSSLTSRSGQPDEEFYRRLYSSPFGNDLVLEFTRELVRHEDLGADPVTDFLFVGFSANDAVGHRWGPYSEQVADMVLRTDEQVAWLLEFLDGEVGAGNYWLVLAADHGVAPTLAQARARGLAAVGVDPQVLLASVEQALGEEFGQGDWLVESAGVTFNRETLRAKGVGVRQASHVAGGALLGVEGVRGYVAGQETRLDPGLTQMVRRSLYRWRTPDVYVLLEPFAMTTTYPGAVHGSPYAYDRHVPLVFYGPAFRAGVYPEKVSPTDLAPTLAAALGLAPPVLADGAVLAQALRNESD